MLDKKFDRILAKFLDSGKLQKLRIPMISTQASQIFMDLYNSGSKLKPKIMENTLL